jgi:excisionase family DNA binding protein
MENDRAPETLATDAPLGIDAPLGDTLSIREVAELLGKDVSTIRRRIQRGHIAAYQRETAHGYEWRILAEGLGASPLGTHPLHGAPSLGVQGVHHAPPLGTYAREDARPVPELMKALEIIEDIRYENREELEQLRRKNDELTAAASHWQARYQETERRAQQAEEQVKLLMAPKDEPGAEPAQPERRSWWRRLWGGE